MAKETIDSAFAILAPMSLRPLVRERISHDGLGEWTKHIRGALVRSRPRSRKCPMLQAGVSPCCVRRCTLINHPSSLLSTPHYPSLQSRSECGEIAMKELLKCLERHRTLRKLCCLFSLHGQWTFVHSDDSPPFSDVVALNLNHMDLGLWRQRRPYPLINSISSTAALMER
jgi:hypothetical protein